MNTGLPSPVEGQALDDPALHAWLRNYVRRRVPSDETDDLVQAILCAALEARQRPTDIIGLRRWLTGVARHLIARHYEVARTARRVDGEAPEPAQAPAPFEERSLALWAAREAEAVAHGAETLDWMAREGDGERLESIAREARVPSARVRQRVSRLRRWMKGRYLAELALASSVAIALAWLWSRRQAPEASRVSDDVPPPVASWAAPAPSAAEIEAGARRQRELAAQLCEKQDWAGCLEALDSAKRIDPAGDEAPSVLALRSAAGAATKAGQSPSGLAQRKSPGRPAASTPEGGESLTRPPIKGKQAPFYKAAPPASTDEARGVPSGSSGVKRAPAKPGPTNDRPKQNAFEPGDSLGGSEVKKLPGGRPA
jgi:DNA-directed RNA polymerase specialized sigma24 family protein